MREALDVARNAEDESRQQLVLERERAFREESSLRSALAAEKERVFREESSLRSALAAEKERVAQLQKERDDERQKIREGWTPVADLPSHIRIGKLVEKLERVRKSESFETLGL